MKATQLLHERGQSLRLDNIPRDLLNSDTLERYIDDLSVTGLTSNPTISERCPRQREISKTMLVDGGDCDSVLDQFAHAGIDLDHLPQDCRTRGQIDGQSWNELMECDRLKEFLSSRKRVKGMLVT